ncbi:hypothetical protein PENSTE_c011G04096 [Penicillium steckii]|uniref:Nucleoside phosphorylase domain-containing protein n=1 Tax=Penicillium steckii TaxID=303698 RepID=A0A1V6T7A2_9EURO|nr:hypothetical protein PENSTE_c011G04096 [Penicillium steckii]
MVVASQQSPFANEQYTVGWICALPIEMAAAKGMLEEEHGAPRTPAAENDQNTYLLGSIGNFKIVNACLPRDSVGSVSAAIVGRDMLSTFTKVRFGLIVGIGSGIPSDEHDIRLGDVVIGSDKASGGVVVHDFGKVVADGSFENIPHLNRLPRSLSTALAQFEASHMLRGNYILGYIDAMLQTNPHMRRLGFSRPVQGTDRLFKADYRHSTGPTCDKCNENEEINREPRYYEGSVIHYGTVVTGDSVMTHAPTRDQLGRKFNANCLDIRGVAAGLMDTFQCIVIRGVSDYADSHKNDCWRAYAAAAAAATAKELLQLVTPKEIDLSRAGHNLAVQDTWYTSIEMVTSTNTYRLSKSPKLGILAKPDREFVTKS